MSQYSDPDRGSRKNSQRCLKTLPLIVLLAVFASPLSACGGGGGGGGGGGSSSVTAPSGLSYPSPDTFTVGTAIKPLAPTVTGTVSSYAVAPALPAGLSLSSSTGVISGAPTAAAAKATYTITASNSGGSTSFGLVLTVALAPPGGLSYPSPDTFTVGTAINPLTPTVTGTVTHYAVAPALPAGLSLSASTGVISGTPMVAAAKATYTITASNASGSTSFGLALTVANPARLSLSATTLDFTDQPVGTTSPDQDVAVINTGAEPVSIDNVYVSGPAADANFPTSSDCATLAPGGTCLIKVAFAPTAVTTQSATLDIETKTLGQASVNLLGSAAPFQLAFDDAIVPVGQSTTLRWSVPGGTNCTASGAWSGSKAASGSQTVSAAQAGYSTYTLTCGAESDSVVLTTYGPTPSIVEPQHEVGHQVDFYIDAPGNQIVGLQTSFVVPPEPPVPASAPQGDVFPWPGLDPASNSVDYEPIGNGVLQPVLSWGNSCAPVTQPPPFTSWWISAQYVNVFGSAPGYMGCFSGPPMTVNPGDLLLINMSLDTTTKAWTQTVTDVNSEHSVYFVENLKGQAQNWAYFAIEQWYGAAFNGSFDFNNTILAFQSPDSSNWCSASSSQPQVNAYGMTPPTQIAGRTACYMRSIVITTQ